MRYDLCVPPHNLSCHREGGIKYYADSGIGIQINPKITKKNLNEKNLFTVLANEFSLFSQFRKWGDLIIHSYFNSLFDVKDACRDWGNQLFKFLDFEPRLKPSYIFVCIHFDRGL